MKEVRAWAIVRDGIIDPSSICDSEAGCKYNIIPIDHTWAYMSSIGYSCIPVLIREEEAEPEGWISVKDRLPEIYSLGMSKDVLVLSGIKMSVKAYDYELRRWTGSPYITITYWMPLPSLPKE